MTASQQQPSFERDPATGDTDLRITTRVERSVEDAFDFFARAENLEAITPSFLHFRITSPTPIEMRAGAQIQYRLRLRGVPILWLTSIDEWEPGVRFVDRQVRGPYRLWVHEHRFVAQDDGSTIVHDHVRYRAPLGRLADRLVRHDLRRIFAYRAEQVAHLLG